MGAMGQYRISHFLQHIKATQAIGAMAVGVLILVGVNRHGLVSMRAKKHPFMRP